MKSCFEPVVDFKSNSKSVKSCKQFRSKNCQIDNKQKCIDYLKPGSNKHERVCTKCGCIYFYVPNY